MSTETQLVELAATWIASARDQMRARGVPLQPERVQRWRAYFPASVLDAVRVVHVESMDEVPSLPAQISTDIEGGAPIELGAIAGLTLVDTICLSRERLHSHYEEDMSLFQELVHATQFERLGTAGFMQRYLEGWLRAGGDNARIPLEAQAEALRQRYGENPGVPFSVESLLAREDGEHAFSRFESPYRPRAPHMARPIDAFEPVQFGRWALKRYAITADGGPCDAGLMEEATALARRTLESTASPELSHGFAYCMVHVGRDGTYVVVDWWTGENMLSQRLFARPAGSAGVFEPFALHDIVTCVWEVQVHAHEARAWIDHVLRQAQAPDFAGYMRDTLSTAI